MFPSKKYFLFYLRVSKRRGLFTVAAHKSYLLRREWKYVCDWTWLAVNFTKCVCTLLSPFSYLGIYTQILQKLCTCVAPFHTWPSVLLEQKNYSRCTVFFAAVVQCCSPAAVIVLHSSVFPPKLPVAICTHSLLPKGFASNKIMYLTT